MLAYQHGLKCGVRLRVLRTVLNPASATFGIIPTHLWDARSARSRLSRVRSAAVTWITRCCLLNLLTFDEFERVMRTVEKCVGNTVKQFEIMYLNWGPIYTLSVTRGVNMVYCISVLQKFNTFCSIQLWMLLIHRDRRGSAKRCAFARCVRFLLKKFPQKYFAN